MLSQIPFECVRRVWDSLVKRRVEAESWEKEAREKDLSLAEVSNFVWTRSNNILSGGGAEDQGEPSEKSEESRGGSRRAKGQSGQSQCAALDG